MNRSRFMSLALAALLPGLAGATPPAHEKVSAACEEALALSALPKRLRADASVYVLTEDGYRLSRKGSGPFTCIVERNHEQALIPQCPDAAGADSVVPGIIRKSEWAIAGVPTAERRERFAADVSAGELKPPARAGISYMMSNFSYAWNSRRNGLIRIPPHVMFYAPNLDNDDIGGSIEEGVGHNRGVPFIVEKGIHGYMTSFVEHPSDSSDVLAACKGQLPDVPPDFSL